MLDLKELMNGIQEGDRRQIGQAITLVESTAPRDLPLASELLGNLPASQNCIRIGISGPPGAGKSTLIDRFGNYLCQLGKRVAVLAIDPTSQKNGGSVLGDKTRMEHLSKCSNAFIRPSPSKAGVLGGATINANDVIRILEAAKFDTILIETIGVGQNEIDASFLTDLMILVLAPALGDDLQGVKRGITEVADIILINKDDGELTKAVNWALQDYKGALAGSNTDVLRCSALKETGFEELHNCINTKWSKLKTNLSERRLAQAKQQFRRRLEQEWPNFISQTPVLKDLSNQIAIEIEGGLSPRDAKDKYYTFVKNLLTASQK